MNRSAPIGLWISLRNHTLIYGTEHLATVRADLKERLLTFFLETADVVPLETDKR